MRLGEAVDAGRDDVVNGRRDRHVGTAQPCLAVLDEDPARLQQLAENLLHVQRISLALGGEDLEELLGDFLSGEQHPHHPVDIIGTEALDHDRLRQRRGEPRRRVAGPRRKH